MSHAVTVTRTTTTTTTSAILLNTGYFKTYPGLLKLLELLIGAVCVGIVAHYLGRYQYYSSQHAELFFLITAVACLVGTLSLLVSCILSISTASILPKTLFEVVFHSIAFILYLAASINFLVEVNANTRRYNYEPYLAAADVVFGALATVLLLCSAPPVLAELRNRNWGEKYLEPGYGNKIFAAILGLVNTVLYLLSTALAYRSYKGK